MPRPKITTPTIYPLDHDLTKEWFVKFPSPIGAPPIKKRGNLASCHTVEDKLAEAGRIILEHEGKLFRTRSSRDQLIKDLESFAEYKKAGLKKKSQQSYDTHFNEFCTWYRQTGFELDVTEIGLSFLTYLSNKPLENTTVNNYRDTIRALFTKLVKAKKFPLNPFDLTEAKDERRHTKEWFRQEDVDILSKVISAADPQLWLACRIQFYCFVRPDCELSFLTLNDIEIADKRIRIKAEYSKSGTYDEFVQIPDILLGELATLKQIYPQHFYLFAHGGKPGRWKLPKAHLYRRHKEILDNLKFPPGYTFYSWKNTGAVMMFKNKISILDISEMMRHKSLDYTKFYFQTLGFSERALSVNLKMPVI